MRQEGTAILGYEGPHVRRARRPMAAGFVGGWLLGVPIGGISIAGLLGGAGIVVPMICAGTTMAGLPAFGLLWFVSRWGSVGHLVAFIIAVITSVAVSFGLLAGFVFSFHGC